MMMYKIVNKFRLLPLLVLLLPACKKEGELIIKPIKETKSYTMTGFALKPLEQYFDGVKVWSLYGASQGFHQNQIVFDEDRITMELKRGSDGQTVYQQIFNIKDADNTVPKFYFDGFKILPRYDHPNPEGKEYKANFYFDFPKDWGAVDVVVEMVEFYYDWDQEIDPEMVIGKTSIPVASNIQTDKWSDYIVLNPLPVLPKSRPDALFQPYVCVKKAGTNEYYASDKMKENRFQLEFPQTSTTQGKVQSIFIGWTKQGEHVLLQPQQDLVQIFP